MSRSEVLRRGILEVRTAGYEGILRDLAETDLVTPPSAGPGRPPPSAPVTSLKELMDELASDRRDR